MANEKNVIRFYKENLNLLLDVAQTINEDSSVAELMAKFDVLLQRDLHVGKILFFFQSEGKWSCLLQSNVTDAQRDSIDIEKDLQDSTEIMNLALNDVESLEGFDAVLPLKRRGKIKGYVLVGDNGEGDGISPTLRNLKFIHIVANVILIFIQNKKMQGRLLKQEGLRQELMLASRIQSGLVPSVEQLLQTSHTHALSYYHPHDKVGGDYYDVMQLSKTSIGFCIADVSGKGFAAALLMSNFQAMVRALFTSTCNMRRLFVDLNRRVSQNTQGEKFITAFIGRYDTITGVLTYVNAGHLPPLLYHGGKVSELNMGSIALGMLDEMPGVDVGRVRMRKGDLMVMYTDGLVEVECGDSVGSNEERLIEILQSGMGIDATMSRLRALAEETRSAGQAFDDTSVLAIEVTRNPLFSFI